MLTSDGKEHKTYNKDALNNADDAVKAEFQQENLCYNIVDKTQGTFATLYVKKFVTVQL